MTLPLLNVEMHPEGFERLARYLESGIDLREPLQQGLTEAGNVIRDEVGRRAPQSVRETITVTVDRVNDVPEWMFVQVNSPLGHLLEHGTGVYGPTNRPITAGGRAGRLRRAVRARETGSNRPPALRFRVGGQTLFRHSVQGMRPRPFFHPGLQAAQGRVQAVLSQMLRRIERRWGQRL